MDSNDLPSDLSRSQVSKVDDDDVPEIPGAVLDAYAVVPGVRVIVLGCWTYAGAWHELAVTGRRGVAGS